MHVCPTGIDIRNGTQLECVNCTACIDACDDVMTKIGKPTGLIRPTSYNAIAEGRKRIFTPRVAGYSGVLTALIVLLIVFVTGRAEVEATVLRVPGMLYQRTEDGRIQNLYNIQFVNKTTEPIDLRIELIDVEGGLIKKVGEPDISVPAKDMVDAIFSMTIPEESLESGKNRIMLGLYSGEELIDEIKTNFLAPIKLTP